MGCYKVRFCRLAYLSAWQRHRHSCVRFQKGCLYHKQQFWELWRTYRHQVRLILWVARFWSNNTNFAMVRILCVDVLCVVAQHA